MKRGGEMGSYRSENRNYIRSREEIERRRKEWKIEQEKAREHERRKKRFIEEYEERRAQKLSSKSHSRRSSHRSRSRSKSRSKSRSRSKSSQKSHKKDKHESNVSKAPIMSEKYDSSSSSKKLFKGGDGTKIPISELKNIKAIIRRNIPSTDATAQLDRTIENPEDIKLIRREGEGIKPIFEREELKKAESSSSKVEEHRKIVAVGSSRVSHSSKKRSTSSPSPRRHHHSRSPQRDSRYRTRTDPEKVDHYESSRHDRDRRKSREHEESQRHLHRSTHNRSHEYRHHSPPREYDDSRYRSRDHDHNRHDSRTRRDSRERDRRMTVPHHYMEPLPVPIFYDNFMRPIMIGDQMLTLRNPVPIIRGRMPPVMGAARAPFTPRLVHPPIFRHGGPPHPRFGRM